MSDLALVATLLACLTSGTAIGFSIATLSSKRMRLTAYRDGYYVGHEDGRTGKKYREWSDE